VYPVRDDQFDAVEPEVCGTLDPRRLVTAEHVL
jgi:hypothetical protein